MKTNLEKMSFLESLVSRRYSEKQLNSKLSEFFGESIEIYNASQGRIDNGEDDDELSDWNLMFAFEGKEDFEDHLDADIYMLPTRELDNDGKVVMYITEVGYEFW